MQPAPVQTYASFTSVARGYRAGRYLMRIIPHTREPPLPASRPRRTPGGEAYGDIVYLASDGGYAGDYFEPSEYQDEAPRARRKALEHYDVALRLTADPLARRRLAQDAWRLHVGLAPLVPHFICVYD